tara:strand:+ start:49 stop:393 length:345 start_codon:yes stop_codon:yes gene_type:complete
MESTVIRFLNKCEINVENIDDLTSFTINRDLLTDNKKYENMKDEIIELKKVFSAGSITALQKTAKNKQKWPLLNLVRQILKIYKFKVTNKRLANGYSKGGTKLFKNIMEFKKIE